MKKVFFIMTMAAACMICMTGCGDDGGVALTGITVVPKTIKMAVGNQQKITVTAVPADATDVVYTYVSQNTSVATVDNNGIVTLVGVGKTTITVTSATFSETVDVEGTLNSIAVKDAAGNIAGVYPYSGQSIEIALTAEVLPAGSAVTPVWTSSAENVTVEAAGNGLTATATLTGLGTAIITATVDNVSGTYTISTESPFDEAAGYWTFEDETNLGKATVGTDLTEMHVDVVPGPSATKKAVQVRDQQKALKWAHNLTISDVGYRGQWYGQPYKIANTYTVLFDVQPAEDLYNIDRVAAPLFYAENTTGRDLEYLLDAEGAAFWVRSIDGVMTLYANGNKWTIADINATKATKPWYRIVVKVWPAVPGDEGYNPNEADNPFHRDLWINGVKVEDIIRGDNTYYRVGMFENSPTWFLTGSEGDRTKFDEGKQRYVDNIHMPCSTIAVWDGLLTDDQIASLGGVSK
jgi:hypothetical protein